MSYVAASLLLSFFEKATQDLAEVSLDSENGYRTVHQLRELILETQQSALSRVLAKVKIEDSSFMESSESIDYKTIHDKVQEQLLCLETHPDFETILEGPIRNMTWAAREALARLVIQQELKQLQHSKQSGIKAQEISSEPFTWIALMEFCGLCQAAIQLKDVQIFLSSPNYNAKNPSLQLYQTPISETLLVPHERWYFLQNLIFRALGYPNANSANQQLQDLMHGDTQDNIGNNDLLDQTEVKQLFKDTIEKVRAALAVASLQMQQEDLNDFEQGGVTRLLSVSHSEVGNCDNDNGIRTAPYAERINLADRSDYSATSDDHLQKSQQTQSIRDMSRQTAAMEQALLAQLLQMDPDERKDTLERARDAHEAVMVALSKLATAAERVAFMTDSTAISQETQRLLLIYRIWQSLLARNGGQPPQMARTRDIDY